MIVRLLVWGLVDSEATIDELRDALPELDEPSAWLWNEATERFGAVLFDDELPPSLERARELIGRDPDVYEEFDSL